MIVDVHAHYSPKVFTDLLGRLSGRPLAPETRPATDSPEHIAKRLELMDEAGVRMQVLSPAGPGYQQKEADGIEVARVGNDAYSELVRRMPDRFAAFASLPLPHIDASLREMERCFDQLGMIGVMMTCSVFERSAAEVEFEPIYEELNRRGGVLFFHPCRSGICSPFVIDYGFVEGVGNSLEDSAIAMHLIARHIPHKYPKIKIIIPHFGGVIPMLLERMDNQRPTNNPDLPEPPSVTARRFYYDTVGHGSAAAMLCGWRAFGADHLVTGSDYPVLLTWESYKETFDHVRDAELPPEDVDKILNRNAAALLGIGRRVPL